MFVGNDAGKVKPHGFYQACKVCGKNSTSCEEKDVDGTTVIEIALDPKDDMKARYVARNLIIEQFLIPTYQYRRGSLGVSNDGSKEIKQPTSDSKIALSKISVCFIKKLGASQRLVCEYHYWDHKHLSV